MFKYITDKSPNESYYATFFNAVDLVVFDKLIDFTDPNILALIDPISKGVSYTISRLEVFPDSGCTEFAGKLIQPPILTPSFTN